MQFKVGDRVQGPSSYICGEARITAISEEPTFAIRYGDGCTGGGLSSDDLTKIRTIEDIVQEAVEDGCELNGDTPCGKCGYVLGCPTAYADVCSAVFFAIIEAAIEDSRSCVE